MRETTIETPQKNVEALFAKEQEKQWKERRTAVIHVRVSGDSHVARAQGYNLTCSCTSDAEWAVQRVALKCKHFPAKPDVAKMDFAQSGIAVQKVTDQTWLAAWSAE